MKGTIITTYIDEVSLNIYVTKKYKHDKSNGFIEIGGSNDSSKNCFWDNLNYFIDISYKEFKKECGEELIEKSYNVKKTYKAVKKLIKEALKAKILKTDSALFLKTGK